MNGSNVTMLITYILFDVTMCIIMKSSINKDTITINITKML